MSDVSRIPIGANGQHEALVDALDYPVLTQWRWSFKISAWRYGRKVYARRHHRINGQRKTTLMHVYILETLMKRRRPSDKHTVHHKDGNSLNNTRGNLGWASPSTQSRRQKPRLTAAERATVDNTLSC